MALSNEELQDLIQGLTPAERKALFKQLGIQIEINNILDITDDEPADKPKRKPPEGMFTCCG